MKKLVSKTPNYRYDFYQEGVYKHPFHHIDHQQSRMRLLIAKAMVEYVLHFYSDINLITDLGCGDGGLLEQIYRKDKRFVGIDISKANIGYAQRRLLGQRNVELLNKDFTKLKTIKSDLIIICETLEHLLNPVKTLKTFDCKYLIASVPIGETEDKHSQFHLWGWTMAEFAKLITKNGFDIISHIKHNQRTQLVLARCK